MLVVTGTVQGSVGFWTPLRGGTQELSPLLRLKTLSDIQYGCLAYPSHTTLVLIDFLEFPTYWKHRPIQSDPIRSNPINLVLDSAPFLYNAK